MEKIIISSDKRSASYIIGDLPDDIDNISAASTEKINEEEVQFYTSDNKEMDEQLGQIIIWYDLPENITDYKKIYEHIHDIYIYGNDNIDLEIEDYSSDDSSEKQGSNEFTEWPTKNVYLNVLFTLILLLIMIVMALLYDKYTSPEKLQDLGLGRTLN